MQRNHVNAELLGAGGEMSDVESVMMAKDIIAPFVGALARRLLSKVRQV